MLAGFRSKGFAQAHGHEQCILGIAQKVDGNAVAGIENDAIVRDDVANCFRDQCVESILELDLLRNRLLGVLRDVEEQHAADERAVGALGHHLGVTCGFGIERVPWRSYGLPGEKNLITIRRLFGTGKC